MPSGKTEEEKKSHYDSFLMVNSNPETDEKITQTEDVTVSDLLGCRKPNSHTPYRDFHCFYLCEIILSHIPTHTRSSDPYVSSLSEKSVPHRYPCEISVTNTR